MNIISASEGEGYIYSWKRNGRTISGAKSQIYQPHRSGDYQVKIIQGSCFDWSPVMHIDMKRCNTNDTLREKPLADANQVDDKEDSVLVSIYPNPNNGLFTLEINMQQVQIKNKEVKVEVVNSIGQIIYSKVITNTTGYVSHHVELAGNVTPGIYVMRITMGDEVEKNRLMLVR
jgi:hypothetical protein